MRKQGDIVCFSKSDFAGDHIMRRSVYCFVPHVLGVPISWQSKTQRSMTLSSSQTEMVELSEFIKGVIAIVKFLKSIMIPVKPLAMVRVDNINGKKCHCH